MTRVLRARKSLAKRLRKQKKAQVGKAYDGAVAAAVGVPPVGPAERRVAAGTTLRGLSHCGCSSLVAGCPRRTGEPPKAPGKGTVGELSKSALFRDNAEQLGAKTSSGLPPSFSESATSTTARELPTTHRAAGTTAPESRGQRRRASKRHAWLRKYDFARYMKALQEKDEDLRKHGRCLTEFDLMKTELETIPLNAPTTPTDNNAVVAAGSSGAFPATVAKRRSVGTYRSRRKALVSELHHFEAVLNFHPFKRDPLGAVKCHLLNTTKNNITQKKRKNV